MEISDKAKDYLSVLVNETHDIGHIYMKMREDILQIDLHDLAKIEAFIQRQMVYVDMLNEELKKKAAEHYTIPDL